MTKEMWLEFLSTLYFDGFFDSERDKPYNSLRSAIMAYDYIISNGGTLPVESVEDPSEYLPTNSTQTLASGL